MIWVFICTLYRKVIQIEEIWKPIKNYEGLYEVSNLGRNKRCNKIRKR